MEIRIRIDGADGTFKPGSRVNGVVELESADPVAVDDVELRVTPPPGCTTTRELTGTLSRGMQVNGTATLPLAINIDSAAGSDADGPWRVEVTARDENRDDHKASATIRVAASLGQKTAGALMGLLIAAPFFAAGALGMGFGIGGVPEKLIPEGVLWFAFGGGILAMLIARAILAAKDARAVTPWLAAPMAILLLAGAALGLYVAMLQPDFIPLERNFTGWRFQPILSLADDYFARPQVMGLIAATVLATAAGGILSRRQVPPVLQMEIGLSTAAVACALICLGYIGAIYRETSGWMLPAAEIIIFGIIGIVVLFSTFSRPSWTQAPAVTLFAGFVPLLAGLIGLAADSRGTIETITAGVTAAWGVLIIYMGGRNILTQLLSGQVAVEVSPNPAFIGESVVVNATVRPRAGVTVSGLTAVIRCQQHDLRTVNGDHRIDVYEIHKERKRVSPSSTQIQGEEIVMNTFLPIPLGSLPSNTGSRAVIWTVEVIVNFAGRPDHAEEFVVQVE